MAKNKSEIRVSKVKNNCYRFIFEENGNSDWITISSDMYKKLSEYFIISGLTELSNEAPVVPPLQNASGSFLSDGMTNKINKQIGSLAEKQGVISGVSSLMESPTVLQKFMIQLAADYGRQIEFLKSVLANEC